MISKLQGFTVVELLIASLLSLFLLAGLLQIYLSIKTSFQLQQALSLLQENGRFATYVLNQNIRLADKVMPYTAKKLFGTDGIVIQKRTKLDTKQFATISFFIATTSHENSQGKSINGLYMRVITDDKKHTQELVSGVDNMQIQYGVLNENHTLIYRNTQQMGGNDWHKIRSVRIALFLNSIEDVLSKLQTDRMLHREWDTYIALRESLNS